jgi:hypothetical protein
VPAGVADAALVSKPVHPTAARTDAAILELCQAGRQLVGQKPSPPGLEVDGFEILAHEVSLTPRVIQSGALLLGL